jgi:hypothetical protein
MFIEKAVNHLPQTRQRGPKVRVDEFGGGGAPYFNFYNHVTHSGF